MLQVPHKISLSGEEAVLDAIAEMMKTQSSLDADDVQKEYIKEASERICKCW